MTGEGVLGVYIGFSPGKEKPTTQNVSMEVPWSYCFPFIPDGEDTEDSVGECLPYIQDFTEAWKYVKLQG